MKSKKIRVLMIGPGASKVSSGGIVTVIDNIMQNLDQDIIVKHIVTMRPTNALMRLYIYFQSLFFIFINIINNNTKIAHVHMSYRTSFYRKSSIIMLLKLFRVPIIIHLHSGEFDIFFEELNPTMQKYVKWIYSLTDKTILLTEGWHKWYKNTINTNKSMVIYNGVRSYYDEDSMSLSQRENIILFLGRLEEKKGIYDLLYAFKEVLKKVPDARLKVCGDGEIKKCKQHAKQLNIDTHVEFLGWVNEEQKYQLLNKSKIYILPSYYEGLPMGVLEAMSAGIAVISTDVGGTPEVIENKKNGILIKAGSSDQICENIILLLQNPDKTEQLGVEAKEYFVKNLDITMITKEIEEVYYELLR